MQGKKINKAIKGSIIADIALSMGVLSTISMIGIGTLEQDVDLVIKTLATVISRGF